MSNCIIILLFNKLYCLELIIKKCRDQVTKIFKSASPKTAATITKNETVTSDINQQAQMHTSPLSKSYQDVLKTSPERKSLFSSSQLSAMQTPNPSPSYNLQNILEQASHTQNIHHAGQYSFTKGSSTNPIVDLTTASMNRYCRNAYKYI